VPTTLSDLADLLVRHFIPPGGPVWVSIHGTDPLELRAGHDIVGWTATPSCRAVGVVAHGRARVLGDGDGPPSRVVLACVMDREGRTASHGFTAAGPAWRDAAGSGLMVDLLRRALLLPTEPPERGPELFLASLWMARVAELPRGRRLGWPRMAALHPAVSALAAAGEVIPPAELATVIRLAGAAWTWGRLRELALGGPALDARMAAWLDDGAFARWACAGQPPLIERVVAAGSRVTAAAWHRAVDLIETVAPDWNDDAGTSWA